MSESNDMTLRPASGYGRLRARAFGPSQPALSGALRHALWVGRLGRRYGVRGDAWVQLSSTLHTVRATTKTVTQQQAVHHNLYRSYNWSLALTLRLQPALAPVAGSAAAVVPRAMMPGGAPRMRLPTQAVVVAAGARRQSDPQSSTTVMTRIYQRTTWATEQQRLTTVLRHPAGEGTGGAIVGAVMTLPPAPRIVTRPAAATASAQSLPVAPAPTALRYWDDPAPPQAAPLLSVEQMTDHVIRTIDQRVVAARERLGKS